MKLDQDLRVSQMEPMLRKPGAIGQCKSLFEDKFLASTTEALDYDKRIHGFDLNSFSLDFYDRVRLINYIRKEKPSAQSLRTLSGKEFSYDDYLLPVIEDDPLLLGPLDSWSDSEDGSNLSAPTDLATANRRIATLELKLAAAKEELTHFRLLVHQRMDTAHIRDAINAPDGHIASPSRRDDDSHYFESYGESEIHAVMIQDRVRTSSYASFIMTNADLFQNAVVLDVGCGTGILSLFAARAGAKRVIAIDASDIALKAKRIVEANGYENVITVIQGKVEEISLPDDISHVDVIVSEWMGYALLYESMLDSVLHARDRFLKPAGVMAPSQCRMMLCLSEASDIYKERIGFWNDIYGFDLSVMGEEVFTDAVVDIVGPDTVMSEPYMIKDLYLRDITTKQLEFMTPFSLVSTAERRTKIHALVLYFDAFFEATGSPVSSNTAVRVTRGGEGELAEVWPLGRRPSALRRQSLKSRQETISFSTGPRSVPTHWKHTIFLLREPVVVTEGTIVAGTFHCRKRENNSRELDVEVHYTVKSGASSEGIETPGDVVVQIFKVR
ncbi:S-adenosyl-L-methionine-dependent methyltransferase [Multifurca ochricompacta]|uniref:type I protein arginine methyltransferase n=1 Tax=Multifurca ochricompacta TaxID=376703 RepID=A0AAD4LVX1_9AGAM|nr:S-adenosyl-L-methionine-dependent methyltransferase [Multifurca ochricompacta]